MENILHTDLPVVRRGKTPRQKVYRGFEEFQHLIIEKKYPDDYAYEGGKPLDSGNPETFLRDASRGGETTPLYRTLEREALMVELQSGFVADSLDTFDQEIDDL
jgi:hypothetical protein